MHEGPAPQVLATRSSDRESYTLPDGTRLPSVTRILDRTMRPEKAAALAKWRQRIGDVEAERTRKAAASRGSALHMAIARRLAGQLTMMGESVWMRSVERVLAHVRNVLPIGDANPAEPVPVYNTIYGYAGTPDLVADVDLAALLPGTRPVRGDGAIARVLFDWTTWDTAPREPGRPKRTYRAEYSHDKQIQLAAYANALPESHGIEVDMAIAVVALPDRAALTFVVDLDAAWSEFQERLATYHEIGGAA